MKVLALLLLLTLRSLYSSNYLKLNMLSELDMRRAFYNDLIKKYGMEDRVELTVDETNYDLSLRAKMEFKGAVPVGGAETRFFFSSCEYYPFMEVINKAIYAYSKTINEEKPDQLLSTFNLVYNILYHKYGDSTKTKAYYEKMNDFKEFIKFIRFDVDGEVKRYLMSLPFYTTRSILNLNDEELKVAESYNISLNFRNNAFKFYDFIINYVKENTSEEVQKLMNLFIAKKDEYVATLNFLNTKKFYLSADTVSQLNFSPKDPNYFTNFLAVQFEDGLAPESCKVIAPIFDLIKFEIPKVVNEAPVQIHFNNYKEDFVGFTTSGSFANGEVIKSGVLERISSEFNFILTGRVPEENLFDNVDFSYKIKKEDITESQIAYCVEIRCSNFDIVSAMKNPEVKEITFNFNVINGNINDEIIKIIKIFNIKKIHQSIKPFIQLNAPFNYNIEAISLTKYLTYLMKFKSDLKEENFLNVYYKNKNLLKNKQEKHKKDPNAAMFEEENDKPRLDILDSIYEIMQKKLQIVNFNVQRIFEKFSKTLLNDIKKNLKI